MKTDTYTRIVLTIIAFCLSVNLLQEIEIMPTVYASEANKDKMNSPKYQLVPISESNTIDVRLVDINTYDELNVNLKGVDTYDEVKVNLKKIETSDELDINIDEIGGSFVRMGGPLPVTLD
ncbi:MAG: hypothetical protein CMC08_00950 [Flavobacteriaceae bacterium]|nr:hypothetical protein [Flavobacteriaceae bacterium]